MEKEQPDYTRTVKIIANYDEENLHVPICTLTQEVYWNNACRYVFVPIYDNIDRLRETGHNVWINGIDLDLRLDQYVREHEPQFLLSRTPSSNREDLQELLRKYGLMNYDRIDFLIQIAKHGQRSSIDNLTLEMQEEHEVE